MGERLKIIVNDCLTNGDFLSCEEAHHRAVKATATVEET
jgi:hypothetical protein